MLVAQEAQLKIRQADFKCVHGGTRCRSLTMFASANSKFKNVHGGTFLNRPVDKLKPFTKITIKRFERR